MEALQRVQESKIKVSNGTINIKFGGKSKGGLNKTRKLAEDNTFSILGEKFYYCTDTKEVKLASDVPGLEVAANQTKLSVVPQSNFGINKRFGFLEKFSSMVLDSTLASLLVSGEGGLGKTHTILAQLNAAKLVEDEDYIIIKGYSTPKALYATLFENRQKIVVFDDCDSVLKDPISLNILKGALDSYDKRTISWLSRGFIDDGLPSQFNFHGQVIFISNLPITKIDGAVRSRTLSVDLSMTLKDKIERMTNILPDILPEYDLDLKKEVLAILDDKKEVATELNMRTLEKSIKVFSAYGGTQDGIDAIEYLLTNA